MEAGVTCYGFISSVDQAHLYCVLARQGKLPRILRRLNSSEKSHLIQSGAIFVYDKEESQIQRWTDGRSWGSSVLENHFLVCRNAWMYHACLRV